MFLSMTLLGRSAEPPQIAQDFVSSLCCFVSSNCADLTVAALLCGPALCSAPLGAWAAKQLPEKQLKLGFALLLLGLAPLVAQKTWQEPSEAHD